METDKKNYRPISTKTTKAMAIFASLTVLFFAGVLVSAYAGENADSSDIKRLDKYISAVNTGNAWDKAMSGNVDDLKAIATQLMEPNTWQGPNSSPPIAKNKHIVVVPCMMAAEGCSRPALAFQEAAEAAGWTTTLIDPGGDPAKVQGAFRQALTMKADGVFASPIMEEQVSNILPELKAAGIAVVSCGGQDLPWKKGWDANVNERDPEMSAGLAIYLSANYPNAKILIVNDSEFSSVRDSVNIFKRLLPKYCPTCQILDEMDFSIVDIATTMPQRVKATLLANPSIDWVFAPYDAAGALMVPAIMQAGLKEKVHLFSWNGDPRNLDFIKKGQVQAFTVARCLEWVGWAGVDQMNRIFNGQAPWEPQHENVGTRLFDKTNAPEDNSEPWDGDIDFRAKFKKIWGIN